MFKRLMKMKEDKKGFTLAELLIVVAIIGVLVAVSIPIFTAQLTKARRATNQANLRAAKAAAVADYLVNENFNGKGADYVYKISSGTVATPVAFTKAGPITDIIDTKQISSTSNYTAITVHIDAVSTVTFTAS